MDKNDLKIIRLPLERRANFTMYGGVRFGGTLRIDDAFRSGEIRQCGESSPSSAIVVIDGGLTAIDTATEALAYYPVQVENFLARCDQLQAGFGS